MLMVGMIHILGPAAANELSKCRHLAFQSKEEPMTDMTTRALWKFGLPFGVLWATKNSLKMTGVEEEMSVFFSWVSVNPGKFWTRHRSDSKGLYWLLASTTYWFQHNIFYCGPQTAYTYWDCIHGCCTWIN